MAELGTVANYPFKDNLLLKTTEMHTGGEPFRIVGEGYPPLKGTTILEKRSYIQKHLDHYRKLLMFEPRGHFDMYGALIVPPDIEGADIGVIFMHNKGYSTMCGHGVIALGRYTVDHQLVQNVTSPETKVAIQCPCGLVEAFVEYSEGKTGRVRFHSVPAFAFKTDIEIEVDGYGKLTVDISYGGAFYAFASAQSVGLNLKNARVRNIVDAADAISAEVKKQVTLSHPDSSDLAFLYGTIITDGKDDYSDESTANICVFAERQVDRSPTGSGVTARIALQYHKGLIHLDQTRQFESGVSGSIFTGKAVKETVCGKHKAVVVEVSGKACYMGTNTFTLEEDDKLGLGFLVK